MNLIEKVANAIQIYWLDTGYLPSKYNEDLAIAAISAMPSIKWQKIETLPEEYKDGRSILVWALAGCYQINYNYIFEKFMNTIIKLDVIEITHWAEINAPEDE